MLRSERKAAVTALAVTLALALLSRPFGLALRMLLPGGAAWYYAGVIVEELVLWGLPALALRERTGTRKKPDLTWCAAAIALGGCLQGCCAAILTMLGDGGGQTVTLPATAAEWALAVLALTIMPAVCEEGFFRGALLGALKDCWPAWLACAGCAAVFALLHGSASGLPGQMAVGVTAGVLMLASGSVLPAVLTHAAYNGAALGLAFCPRMDALALLGLVWLAGLVWIARRIRWSEGGEVTRTEALIAAGALIAACASLLT